VTNTVGKRLVLVRHGETEWSRDGGHTGRTDLPRTTLGCNQGRQLGRRLLLLHIAPVRVLSSPRERALETARLAGFAHSVELSEALAELDYGAYEGRTTADLSGRLLEDGIAELANGERRVCHGARLEGRVQMRFQARMQRHQCSWPSTEMLAVSR